MSDDSPPNPPADAATLPPRDPNQTVAHLGAAAAETATLPPSNRVAPPPLGPVQVPGYEIVGELGRGGMGVVYKARQVGLNRPVALKMILSGGHAGAADRDRFRTEAEAVARLQHPNVVAVHEVGEHDGRPYFSLEYCAGGSLAERLDGTPWEPHRAAALVETLARAVQAAHVRQIVHRDLKPGNILLAEDGTPKITDFGLAKQLDSDAGHTASGAILGTPSYMAPEQAGGSKAIGPAADVYALGAILYELLTGRPPFKAATPLDTVLQVVSDEPVPPTRLQSKTPRDLETVCLKCLAKEPGRRYATAAALAEDLRRFQTGEPIAARPAGAWERAGRWVGRNPLAAAGLSALPATMFLGSTAGILTGCAVASMEVALRVRWRIVVLAVLATALAAPGYRVGFGLTPYERQFRAVGRSASTSGLSPRTDGSSADVFRGGPGLRTDQIVVPVAVATAFVGLFVVVASSYGPVIRRAALQVRWLVGLVSGAALVYAMLFNAGWTPDRLTSLWLLLDRLRSHLPWVVPSRGLIVSITLQLNVLSYTCFQFVPYAAAGIVVGAVARRWIEPRGHDAVMTRFDALVGLVAGMFVGTTFYMLYATITVHPFPVSQLIAADTAAFGGLVGGLAAVVLGGWVRTRTHRAAREARGPAPANA